MFDCSAKCSEQCPSLTECLYRGQPLINNSSANSKQGKFAYIADVFKELFQNGLNVDDKNSPTPYLAFI